jgi:hypothetical protein
MLSLKGTIYYLDAWRFVKEYWADRVMKAL